MAGPPPPCSGSPCNITPGVLSPDFTNSAAPVHTGSVVSTTDGTWDAFTSISAYKFQSGATVLQSGASNSYTVQSGDAGDTITAYVEGCDMTCVWQQSTGSAKVVGAAKFTEDFNGAANCSSTCLSGQWTAYSGAVGDTTMNGWNNMGETGSGSLEIQETCTGTGCSTPSTCTSTTCTWLSGDITTTSAATDYSGERYLEVRAENVCNGTGTYRAGVDQSPAFEFSSLTSPNNNLEVDGAESWSGSANNGYHQYAIHHTDAASGGSAVDYYQKTEGAPTAQCGAYHVYGYAIYPSHIDFYYDGTLEKTLNRTDTGLAACSPAACSPDSLASVDLTTYVMRITSILYSKSTYPTDTGPFKMYIDYIHVNGLS